MHEIVDGRRSRFRQLLDAGRTGLSRGMPTERGRELRLEAKPTVRSPQREQVRIPTIEIVARIERTYHAAREHHRDHGGIFHLDRLPADVPAESANLRDGISGQIAD